MVGLYQKGTNGVNGIIVYTVVGTGNKDNKKG